MLSDEITDHLGNGAANVHASIIATPAFCRELNRIRENDFSRNPKLWPVFQDRGFHKVVAARAHHAPTAELLANYPDSTELLTGLQSECHVPEHGLEPGTLPDRLLFAAALSKAWENPASVENVMTMPSDPAIYGSMLGLLANPNLVYREYCEMADELEKAVVRQIATLVGYDANQATGVFTHGGTFCNMYGYLFGIRKTMPESLRLGLEYGQDYRIIYSQGGHYSNTTNLSVLGVNIARKTIRIQLTEANDIDLADLERHRTACFQLECVVPTIMLTLPPSAPRGRRSSVSPTSVSFIGNNREAAGNKLGGILVWNLPDAEGGKVPPPARQLAGNTNEVTRLLTTSDQALLISEKLDHTIKYCEMSS